MPAASEDTQPQVPLGSGGDEPTADHEALGDSTGEEATDQHEAVKIPAAPESGAPSSG